MKKQKSPARGQFTTFRQVCNLIPTHLVPKLARETGVDEQARTFSPWSHVVSLIYSQTTHSIGLNDVCDGLELHSGPLSAIRGATPPKRNTLSHANKRRDAAMAEQLFWQTLEHLRTETPAFAGAASKKRGLFRFKRPIHVIDSTTLELVARCMDWAKHRRRKAAAKCHLRLDLQSFLPSFVVIDTAREADPKRARELCAGVRSGEIIIFDKAYLDFLHLWDLDQRGIFWVSRAKENLQYQVEAQLPAGGKILRDEIVSLKRAEAMEKFPAGLRRIVALVEVDGREVEMTFLTNNLDWAPASVADLYRARWTIEVFFKQIKQTLQLSDFLGNSANAVRWQVWMALLVYLLLRYLAWQSAWSHSFSRLFTVVRAALWQKLDLAALLKSYGTAGGSFRCMGAPQQAFLPGFV
jgi:hypothetical protein